MKLLRLLEAIDLMYNELPSGMDMKIYYTATEEESIIILDKNENEGKNTLPDDAILIAEDPITFLFYVERAMYWASLERRKYSWDSFKNLLN